MACWQCNNKCERCHKKPFWKGGMPNYEVQNTTTVSPQACDGNCAQPSNVRICSFVVKKVKDVRHYFNSLVYCEEDNTTYWVDNEGNPFATYRQPNFKDNFDPTKQSYPMSEVFDLANGKLYVYDKAGKYYEIGIVGPQGAQGPKGDVGPQGPTGPKGDSVDADKFYTKEVVDQKVFDSGKKFGWFTAQATGTKVYALAPEKGENTSRNDYFVTLISFDDELDIDHRAHGVYSLLPSEIIFEKYAGSLNSPTALLGHVNIGTGASANALAIMQSGVFEVWLSFSGAAEDYIYPRVWRMGEVDYEAQTAPIVDNIAEFPEGDSTVIFPSMDNRGSKVTLDNRDRLYGTNPWSYDDENKTAKRAFTATGIQIKRYTVCVDVGDVQSGIKATPALLGVGHYFPSYIFGKNAVRYFVDKSSDEEVAKTIRIGIVKIA
nr:MAG TPA: collagen alpha 1(VIII) chain protein [Caudoviricetes sp.]